LKRTLLIAALAAFFCFLLIGCASLIDNKVKNFTSSQIGCPPEEIIVKDFALSTETWKAECRGIKYYCSSTSCIKAMK
jgi:hypothetical protein